MRDTVPIGVFRQTRPKPSPQYKVLGLALVKEWQDGYFLIEGITAPSSAIVEGLFRAIATEPESLEDARKRIEATIVLRQGRGAFRSGLLEAYGGRCAITDCDVPEALEAAHIIPYRGEHTNRVNNGLLLRADLHTLFDLGLIAVDTPSFSVLVHPRLLTTVYGELARRPLRLPKEASAHPNAAALDEHKRRAVSRWNSSPKLEISLSSLITPLPVPLP
jgi:hypothetical protein